MRILIHLRPSPGVPKAISVDSEIAFGDRSLMVEPTKLRAIAERLNISQSTVSRALNDYQDISNRTKKLVRDTAEELGYEPNLHARRLASGKSCTIGYVMPTQDGQLTETFLGELMAGMATALAVQGWDLTVLAPASTEEEMAVFQKIARTRHLSGLVISRTYTDDPRFQILSDLAIPFVSHGRSSTCGDTAWLDVDNELAFTEMTSHLVSLGHSRIAHIGGSPVFNFARQRADGWRRGLREAGLEIREHYAEVADLSFEGGCAAMERLLGLDAPPTAVCCVSDVVAIGAMQAIRTSGLQPGREVSIIGYDGLELGAWLNPPLTTMRQPLQSAGRMLADMLIKLVEGERTPANSQELFRASFVRRGTANPPIADWLTSR